MKFQGEEGQTADLNPLYIMNILVIIFINASKGKSGLFLCYSIFQDNLISSTHKINYVE